MRAKFQPWLVSALVVLVLLATGVVLFNSLRNAVKQSVEDDLSSIATLKAEQISAWIDDRYSDVQSVGADSYFSQAVLRWLESGHRDERQRLDMRRQLEAFVAAHHFSGVELFDPQGEELLQVGVFIPDQAHMRANALHAMQSGSVEFVDLHRHAHDAIELAAGVISPLKVDGKVVGAIYFFEDASRYLFPLLQHWPDDSKTAELELVRAEEDRVLYLGPLLHRNDPPLTFSQPMDTPDLTAAAALRGAMGMLPRGRDYSGQEVLAFATPINGTHWVLIAKMDEAEAYALVDRVQFVALFVILLLLGATGAWFLQWQRRQYLLHQAEEMSVRLASEARVLESEKRFRIVFEQAAFAIARISLEGELIEVNDAWCSMFGIVRHMLLARRWKELMHPDDRNESEALLRQLLGSEIAHARMQKRYLGKDGRIIWGSDEVSLVRDSEGNPEYYIAAIQDVTARKLLEEKLENNLVLLKMAMDGAREALWEWDLVSGEAKFSPEYYTMLGYLPDEFLSNEQEWLSRIHPDDRKIVLGKMRHEPGSHGELYFAEYRMRTKDGRYRWLQGRGKCTAFDKDGKPLRLVGINMDINERKQMELQVSFLAYHDKLTGLPNRALLFDRFSQALSQAKRDRLHVGLLFADLDGFKQVNDEHGHEAGDMVLKMAAQRLLACVREVDTVVRFGGDEFAVILGNLDDAQQAALVADKIVHAFAAAMTLGEGVVCRVGVSIGISLFPENGTTMDGLLTAADQAMYDSKHVGKNTYSFFGNQLALEDDQWIRIDESNLLGITEIDELHRNLARLLNKLNSAWRHGQSQPVLMDLFENLINATAEHFESEGRYMAQYGYEQLQAHEKEHALLLDEAMRLRERIREGGELLALQTIKDWLLNHIIYMDKPMASYLLSRGV